MIRRCRVLWILAVPMFSVAVGVGAAPRISAVAPMDRWIDLDWDYTGPAPGGFMVEVAGSGHDFKLAERAGPEARSASVYVTDRPWSFLGLGGKLQVRVAALDAAGQPESRSEVVAVRPARRRDIEAEVRDRFGYWEKRSSYNANDPVYTVVYSEAQKQQQRQAARAMFAELQVAATNMAAPRHFTIPPGTYRVEPGQMALKGVSNFTLHAPGVEIIVDSEKSGAAFVFNACTNITLTGRAARPLAAEARKGGSTGSPQACAPLIVDSEQLPMSVARIVAVDTNKLTLDVEVLPGYITDLPESERMMAYDAKGRLLNVEQMGWRGIEKVGASRFRLTTASLRRAENRDRILVPGSLLAIHNNEGHKARTHGVVAAHGCKDMTYEGIRVLNGGGAPADHGTAGYTVFRDWRLFPRPGTSRLPIATGLGQFSKNGGTFIFEDCEFGPHLDDGINLLSGMSIVGRQEAAIRNMAAWRADVPSRRSDQGGASAVEDARPPEEVAGQEASKIVVVTGWQQPTVGSTLTFYGYTNWVNLGEAKVVASEQISDTSTLDQVNAFAQKNRTVPNAHRAFRTVLDRPIKTTPFAMAVHSDYRADLIVVRGCLFRDQLAQIMLLQGAKSGLVENNLLLRSTGGGVSAQFAQYWWEGPMPSNFLIRNNVIRDNPVALAVNGFEGNAAIAVFAGTKYPTNERLLHGFRIEGNTIISPSVYGIAVRNTEDVRICHNRIVNPGAWDTDGMFRGRPIRDLYAAIVLDAVSHAEVTDNEIVFGNPRCQRAVLVETNCDAATVRVECNRVETKMIP